VAVIESGGKQRIEQHMARLDHPVAFAQFRLEECADAGLEQHGLAVEIIDQQRAAGERDAVLPVRRDPFFPHRFRHVAEHSAAIEALRVADDRPELHALSKSSIVTLVSSAILRNKIGEISWPLWNGTVVARPSAWRNCLCEPRWRTSVKPSFCSK